MTGLLACITNWLYQYGVICAGIPSAHGSYEASVPEQLRSGMRNEARSGFLEYTEEMIPMGN